MKLTSILIFLCIYFINFSLGQWSSLSCSLCTGEGASFCQEEFKICFCNDGYIGMYCNETSNFYVNGYIPAALNGGYGWINGFFKNTTDISLKIGGENLELGTVSQFQIQFLGIEFDPSKLYNITVKQGNQEWFAKDYYSPLGLKCDDTNGYPYNNFCYCLRGYTGPECLDPSPVAIDSISPNVLPEGGGQISGKGWFGNNNFDKLLFSIGNITDSITISFINSTDFQGIISVSSNLNNYQSIEIYNTTSGELAFSGKNMIYFDSSICKNNNSCQSSSSSINTNSSSNSNNNSDNNSSFNSTNSIISFLNIKSIFIYLIIIIITLFI